MGADLLLLCGYSDQKQPLAETQTGVFLRGLWFSCTLDAPRLHVSLWGTHAHPGMCTQKLLFPLECSSNIWRALSRVLLIFSEQNERSPINGGTAESTHTKGYSSLLRMLLSILCKPWAGETVVSNWEPCPFMFLILAHIISLSCHWFGRLDAFGTQSHVRSTVGCVKFLTQGFSFHYMVLIYPSFHFYPSSSKQQHLLFASLRFYSLTVNGSTSWKLSLVLYTYNQWIDGGK